MNEVKIRYCDLSSLEGSFFFRLVEFDRQFMDYSWSEKSWESAKSNPSFFLFVVENHEDELIGFSLWQKNEIEPCADLLKIVVAPDLRGKGVARLLWEKSAQLFLKEGVEVIFLQVSTRNKRAMSFYEALGFQKSREMKNFYHDGCSALELILKVAK